MIEIVAVSYFIASAAIAVIYARIASRKAKGWFDPLWFCAGEHALMGVIMPGMWLAMPHGMTMPRIVLLIAALGLLAASFNKLRGLSNG